ncbi:MAG: hypothetical protein ACK4N5_23910, partial [Myxococcales bacterium]
GGEQPGAEAQAGSPQSQGGEEPQATGEGGEAEGRRPGEGRQDGTGSTNEAGTQSARQATPAGAPDARSLAEQLERRRQALESAFQRQQRLAETGTQRRANTHGGGGTQDRPGGQQGQPGAAGTQAGQSATGERTGETGTGAPTRGGGIAPVTFGEEVQVQAERLKLEALPEGGSEEADQLLGIQRRAPNVNRSYAPTEAGAAGAGPDGVGPRQAPLPPRHRETIRRYFDSGSGGRK